MIVYGNWNTLVKAEAFNLRQYHRNRNRGLGGVALSIAMGDHTAFFYGIYQPRSLRCIEFLLSGRP